MRVLSTETSAPRIGESELFLTLVVVLASIPVLVSTCAAMLACQTVATAHGAQVFVDECADRNHIRTVRLRRFRWLAAAVIPAVGASKPPAGSKHTHAGIERSVQRQTPPPCNGFHF